MSTGDSFDVDAFLAHSPMEPYQVVHRGERKRKGKKWIHSGFSVEVSSVMGSYPNMSGRSRVPSVSSTRTLLGWAASAAYRPVVGSLDTSGVTWPCSLITCLPSC